MNKIISIAFLFLLLNNSSYGQNSLDKMDTSELSIDHAKAEKAKSVVASFSRGLLSGGITADSLLSLCALPFAIDGKRIITDINDFRKTFNDIIGSNGGSPQIHIDSIYVIGTRKEILNDVIPIDVYFIVIEIKIKKGDKEFEKSAGFGVQMTDKPRIIGFAG